MGAGAVGSVLGGLLSVSKHDVLMVGRDDHMRSISADGLRLKSSTAEYLAHPRTINRLSEKDIDADTVVMITAKSHDTSACLDEIARVAPPETTILTMQNGIRNEELAAVRFRDVYGGVCRMTCSMLQPGQASFRHIGRVEVGLYPKGTSPRARAIGKAFAAAGLEVCVSRSIMGDKWLKMAVNVTSAVNAVVDARDHDTPAFFELKARLLEETAAVLAAEKIKPNHLMGKISQSRR